MIFGIITRNKILKLHKAFVDLKFHPKSMPSFDEFENAVSRALNHAKEYEDAEKVIAKYKYCKEHWKDIIRIYKKRLEEWNEIVWSRKGDIEYGNDDESAGVDYFTNALTKDYNKVFFSSVSFEEGIYQIPYKHRKWIFDDETNTYLKRACSSKKIKIYKNRERLATIEYKNSKFSFTDNNSPYFIITKDDNSIEIYDHEYIYSLKHKKLDPEQMLARIDWDIMTLKDEHGMARMIVFEDVADYPVLFSLATAPFLMFRRKMQAERNARAAMLMMAINNTRMTMRR